MRDILIHYHLFKNAGSSVDHLLENSFRERWAKYEGDSPRLTPEALSRFLESHPGLDAVSSHRALLPVPRLRGAEILPVIFLRHPIDRIRSVYEFERRQLDDTPGAKMARETALGGYIDWRRARANDFSVQNFQAWRLAQGTPPAPDQGPQAALRERAIRTMDILPFIGVVEEFTASLGWLARLARDRYPGLRLVPVEKNVSRAAETTLADRVLAVQREIGDAAFSVLLDENAIDLEIHDRASSRLAGQCRSVGPG